MTIHKEQFIVQDLCESRGGRPRLSVLTSLLVSMPVDVKLEPCLELVSACPQYVNRYPRTLSNTAAAGTIKHKHCRQRVFVGCSKIENNKKEVKRKIDKEFMLLCPLTALLDKNHTQWVTEVFIQCDPEDSAREGKTSSAGNQGAREQGKRRELIYTTASRVPE